MPYDSVIIRTGDKMTTILLVEDELEIQKRIQIALIQDGFQVLTADDGEMALTMFDKYDFDMILLDMMLPKIAGEHVLKKIRDKSDIPIIIISALTDELIQLNAFENKADDYVVKPFSMGILVHKVKALLRRTNTVMSEIVKVEGLELQIDNYIATYDGEVIDFTTKEFELLQLLLFNRGKVFSREELLTLIWGYDFFGDARNIDVHIKNIRKKLPIDIIKTVKGIGYRIESDRI